MSRCTRIIILSCEWFFALFLLNNSRRLPKRSCLWIFITSFSLLMACTYVDSCHDPPRFSRPSAPEWTVSCPRKERWREVLFDIRQIRHLHISSVKCKASKLVSQRQWAARPFSEIERRSGPSSSLCDRGGVLYVFEIIWIIWFAWLNLLNLWSSDAPVCLHVCDCLLMCVLFSLTSSCLSSSGAPIRKLPWRLAARQLSCCDGRPRGRKTAWRTEPVEVTVPLPPNG